MDWWHTANLLAQQANINKAKHAPAVKPDKLNPFATKKAARKATPEELAQLLGPNWHQVDTS